MIFWNIFHIFPRKKDLTFHAYPLSKRQFALNVKFYFLGKNNKIIISLLSVEFAHSQANSMVSATRIYKANGMKTKPMVPRTSLHCYAYKHPVSSDAF